MILVLIPLLIWNLESRTDHLTAVYGVEYSQSVTKRMRFNLVNGIKTTTKLFPLHAYELLFHYSLFFSRGIERIVSQVVYVCGKV